MPGFDAGKIKVHQSYIIIKNSFRTAKKTSPFQNQLVNAVQVNNPSLR
jgi:hypothetical protein